MTAAIKTPLAEIETLAAAALRRAGARDEAAKSLAHAIMCAERDGLASHGLAYLATYCEHLACGKVIGSAIPKVMTPKPGQILVDAGNGFAHTAINAGFAVLIPLARAQGIAAVAVRNSYNCGVLGYHTERLASAGLVGLGFTNAPASIAPSGGKKPMFGTNPWSIAIPDGAGGAAAVIDQSASVVAKSEVIKKSRKGEPIPLGWALDANGQPTTDAAAGLKGSMVPAGDYKGVGIAMLVEIMAACLTGANLGLEASPFSGPAGGPPGTGQYFIAIEPAASSAGGFAERVTMLMTAFAVEAGVHVPGSGRKAARRRTIAEGVAVDPDTMKKVRELAAA